MFALGIPDVNQGKPTLPNAKKRTFANTNAKTKGERNSKFLSFWKKIQKRAPRMAAHAHAHAD